MSSSTETSDRPDPVEQILAECLDRPADEIQSALEAACREHPELAETLRRRFARLADLDFVAVASTTQPEAEDPQADFPRAFGSYRLLREIGRGGQGVVYEAEDNRLNRRVALKVLTHASFATKNMLRRFRREAEAASRLDHRGICAVYEVGTAEEMPYIAMRLVDGRPLGADLSTRDREAILRMVRIIDRATRAIHVAHEAGLVHRDLKPDNILVTSDDEPVLLDFGLALDVSGEVSVLTRTDVVVGTPSYMAPEQIQGTRTVDRRADIHALGVILFEAVTGKLPFAAPTVESTWHRICTEEAENPQRLNGDIPHDLAIVILTALEKRPERRYADAAALADDLQRVVQNEPILARPPSVFGKFARSVQRHPLVATLSATIALVLTIGLVSSLVLLSRANEATEAAREALRRNEGTTLLAQAEAQLDQDAALALSLAVAGYERLPTARARSLVARMLTQCRALRVVQEGESNPDSVGISPDGKRWHARFGDTEVYRDIATGALLPADPFPPRRQWQTEVDLPASTVTISEAGSDDEPREVRLAEIPPTTVAMLRAVCETGSHLAVALTGQRRSEQEPDSSVRLIEVATGRTVARCNEGFAPIAEALAISPDGRRLCYGFLNGEVHVLTHNVAGDNDELLLRGMGSPAADIAFSADGNRLVVGFQDGTLSAWDLRGMPNLASWQTEGQVTPVGFDAMGQRLVCGAEYDQAYIFDSSSPDRIVRLEGHPGPVFPARWLAEGRVVTGCQDGVARVFDGQGTLLQTLSGHIDPLFDVDVDSTGRRVATASMDGTARLFDADTGATLAVLEGAKAMLFFAKFSPEGGQVATTSADKVARIYDATTGSLRRELRGHQGPAFYAHWLDEDRLVTTSHDATARIWNVRDDSSIELLGHTASVFWAASSSDGSVLATTSFDHTVRIWDTATGAIRAVLTGHSEDTLNVAFSPDDRWLVTTSRDRTARVWNLDNYAEHLVIKAHTQTVLHACFDPASRRIATASIDGTVRLWPIDPVETARRLMPHRLSEEQLEAFVR